MTLKRTGLLGGAIVLGVLILLKFLGQPVWCQCGQWNLWAGDIWSEHNSQHWLDPYSFTHFCHGLLFFLASLPLAKQLSVSSRFLVTVSLECLWELIENSPQVIQHYRENTISLDYFGDSIINSAGDVTSCSLGFLFASVIPWWGSVALLASIEVGLLLTIRDNLSLNIINLLSDQPTLKAWQAAEKLSEPK